MLMNKGLPISGLFHFGRTSNDGRRVDIIVGRRRGEVHRKYVQRGGKSNLILSDPSRLGFSAFSS
jgi:hypothetical protein